MENKEEMKKWLEDNLLTATQAMKVTEQSKSAFNNAVVNGYIPVYLKLNREERNVNLYLREDLIEYKANKRHRKSSNTPDTD